MAHAAALRKRLLNLPFNIRVPRAQVYVIHHTDCGMLTFKDSDLAKIIKDTLGVDVGDRAFLPYSDVDESVRDDVALLAREPLLLPGTPIIGLTYDVKTGALKEVVKATRA